jgi:mono/diheme cytochrome c family protein
MSKMNRRLIFVAVFLVLWFLKSRYIDQPRYRDVPQPQIFPTGDLAVRARGEYLVRGPGACVECHADPEVINKYRSEPSNFPTDSAMSGGLKFYLPVGAYYAANLTSDQVTGLGTYTGQLIAHTLRNGIGSDEHALPPVMRFADLSDDDLTAIISYLRSRPPVSHTVVRRDWGGVKADLKLSFNLRPVGPSAPPPKSVPEGATVEYGKYLANAVANCAGCHTNQDQASGVNLGEPFAGGVSMSSAVDPVNFIVSPNITPDPKTGVMTNWSEEMFLARFHQPTHPANTTMPWASFSRMKDDDLKALYRYLKTVKAVENNPGPLMKPRT